MTSCSGEINTKGSFKQKLVERKNMFMSQETVRMNQMESFSARKYSPDAKAFKLNNLRSKYFDIPEDEDLINDFSCALKKDVLLHGRLFVGIKNFYFISKILGYETKVSDSWQNVTEVKKVRLANIIPNALRIDTVDSKYTFASFSSRLYVFELILFAIKNQSEKLLLKSEEIRNEVKNSQTASSQKNKNILLNSLNMSSTSLTGYPDQRDIDVDSTDSNEKEKIIKVESSIILGEQRTTDIVIQSLEDFTISKENCCCTQFEFVVCEKIFSKNVDDIFNTLYSENSIITQTIYKKLNFQDYKIIDRCELPDGSIVVKSGHNFPNAFLGKSAVTIVEEKFPNTNKSHSHYQIVSRSTSEGVPFANTFEVCTNTCLLGIGESITLFRVSSEVKFVKKGWSIPKKTIQQSAIKTCHLVIAEIVKELTTLFGAPTDTQVGGEKTTSPEISTSPSFSNKKKNKHKRTPSYGALKLLEIILKLMLILTIFYAIFKISTQQRMISYLKNDLYNCKQKNT